MGSCEVMERTIGSAAARPAMEGSHPEKERSEETGRTKVYKGREISQSFPIYNPLSADHDSWVEVEAQVAGICDLVDQSAGVVYAFLNFL